MNSSKLRRITLTASVLLSVALAACDVPPDCEPCDGTQVAAMCSVDGDCEPEPRPTSVPVKAKVRNDWGEADNFSVEYVYTYNDTSGNLMTAQPIDAYSTGIGTASGNFKPGSSVALRLIRTVHADSTFWVTFSVPSDANATDGAAFVYHLATNTSTPSCPSGRDMCVLGWWEWNGQSSTPFLF